MKNKSQLESAAGGKHQSAAMKHAHESALKAICSAENGSTRERKIGKCCGYSRSALRCSLSTLRGSRSARREVKMRFDSAARHRKIQAAATNMRKLRFIPGSK